MNNSDEIWLPLPSDNKYLISNYGNVIIQNHKCSVNSGNSVLGRIRLISNSSEWAGYKSISIRGKAKLVHRLVAETFIPNPKNLPFVNHKDSNKSNNYYKNLEWCTQSHNCKHSHESGTNPIELKLGSENGRAKLDEIQVRTIRACYPDINQVALAKYFGIAQTLISRIILRKNWNHI